MTQSATKTSTAIIPQVPAISGLNVSLVRPKGEITCEPLTVSVTEAAKLLGISKPTVYTLIRREDFPSLKVGNRTLISYEGLKAWVTAQVGGLA